jgi:hypothetical protein
VKKDMRTKSIIALLIAIVFAFGVVGITFAADAKEVKGTITKVEGKSITVKDSAGKESKVTISNANDVKVGEMVTVKDGKATVEKAPAAAAPAKKSSSGGY